MRPQAFLIALAASLAVGPQAQAQGSGHASVTVTWTAVGTGAGFGIGLWAGLRAFDDAVDSDRKVWTAALVGAAGGALAGYLIGRARRPAREPAVPATREPDGPQSSRAWQIRRREPRAGVASSPAGGMALVAAQPGSTILLQPPSAFTIAAVRPAAGEAGARAR